MKTIRLFSLLFLSFFLMTHHAIGAEKFTAKTTSFKAVSDYIKEHQRLPDHFITKKEARKQGWNPSRGNLWDVAPGKSIGGDVFRNLEKGLPDKKGRVWYEADINYRGGKRGKDRILFSNDGLIYKTEDHYRTFTRIP